MQHGEVTDSTLKERRSQLSKVSRAFPTWTRAPTISPHWYDNRPSCRLLHRPALVAGTGMPLLQSYCILRGRKSEGAKELLQARVVPSSKSRMLTAPSQQPLRSLHAICLTTDRAGLPSPEVKIDFWSPTCFPSWALGTMGPTEIFANRCWAYGIDFQHAL